MKYQQPYGSLDVDAPYVNGDPSIGREGSIPPALAFEQPMRELVNAISNTGIIPSNDDLEQLWRALQIAPWIQQYGVDTGSANVYSASIDPVPTQLYVGMRVAVKIGNDNTGPSTLNINSLGAHSIKRATGANINAGDLRTGQVAYFIFDGANWQIINFLGFTSDTTINNFTLMIPYAVDQGAVNNLVAVFNPAVTALAAGNPFLVKVSNTNTGPVTLKANSLAAIQLVWPDQSQLLAGEIFNGGLIFVVFDGVKFQLLTVVNGHKTGEGDTTITNIYRGVPGTMDLWPTETPPEDAYECNGQALSRVTDSRLFGIIGTRYGAPDPEHFNVPDIRGEFIRGWSHSSGRDPDAATRLPRGDGVGGDHVGTKQLDTFKNHTHPWGTEGGGVTLNFPDPRESNVHGIYVAPGSGIATDYGIVDGLSVWMAAGYSTPFGTPMLGAPIPGASQSNYNFVNRITNLQISGAIGDATGGGSETRPRNIYLMVIIWR